MIVGLELSFSGRIVLWHEIDQRVCAVGNGSDADLCVAEPSIAPVQCLLRREAHQVTLINRSTEGTLVNGEKCLDRMRVAEGDVISLGQIIATVRFRSEVEVVGHTKTLAPTDVSVRRRVSVGVPSEYPGKRWQLGKNGLTIGADELNDIMLRDPFVSGFHARLFLDGSRCMVSDLGSRNGVFVGTTKIREGEVSPGSELRIGRTVVQVSFQDVSDDASDAPSQGVEKLIGSSPAMQQLRNQLPRFASNQAPVLITGETGTGKEVVAGLLVELSPRRERPYVALNCGALTKSLIESELFGHEKGAFTGAVAKKEGAFELAHGGTLFLDEIGELPLELQPQLLRVLETGEFRRVGGTETLRCDVRLLAATNRKLEKEVTAGKFREDLFHRLHVLAIDLPPLRDRQSDVEDLAQFFLTRFAPSGHQLTLAKETLKLLRDHGWPGNIRELRNVLQRAVLLRTGDVLLPTDITFTPTTAVVLPDLKNETKTLYEIERDAIVRELIRHSGNRTLVAEALGISRATIHRKIDEYEIDVDAVIRGKITPP